MADDTERSETPLAPVTYLFGAPERSVDVNEAGTDTAGTGEAQPAWAVPGVDLDDVAAPAPVDTAVADDKDTRRAHNVGLNALTRRGQSVAEMTKLLENRELEPEVVAAEIKRLKSVGLLDDFALADTLVRTLSERKKLGKSSIVSELRQRKIDQTAIDAALEQLDGDDELSRAIEVAVKRAGQLSSYDDTTAKRRLSAYLQRRGYSGSVLSGAMAAAFSPSSGSRSSGSRSSGPRFQ